MGSRPALDKIVRRRALVADVLTAVPVGPRQLHVLFNLETKSGLDCEGSCVFAVDLDHLSTEVLYVHPWRALDYHVEPDGRGYVLHPEGIAELVGGKPSAIVAAPAALSAMAPLGGGALVACGQRGRVVEFAGGTYRTVPCSTGGDPRYPTDLLAIAATPTRGFVGGSWGTFLAGDVAGGFTPVPCTASPFSIVGAPHDQRRKVIAVVATSTGAVLLSSDEGPAVVYDDGRFTTLTGKHSDDTTMISMVEFKGVEYWSDQWNDLYVRTGATLVKVRGKKGGRGMRASADLMTLSTAAVVSAFDGTRWTRLKVDPRKKQLVERTR